jgi:hypothetical protein
MRKTGRADLAHPMVDGVDSVQLAAVVEAVVVEVVAVSSDAAIASRPNRDRACRPKK